MRVCDYDEVRLEVDLLELIRKQELGGFMNHRIKELKVKVNVKYNYRILAFGE